LDSRTDERQDVVLDVAFGPTNKKLVDSVKANVEAAKQENASAPVPVDLVTTSASGLDPDLSPAAADFQVPRVARERGMSETDVRALVGMHTGGRSIGVASRRGDRYESMNRYPTHGSVRMKRGTDGFGSTFLRSDATSTRRCSG
jgi:hypothetical protein